jgi:hypothetical protein
VNGHAKRLKDQNTDLRKQLRTNIQLPRFQQYCALWNTYLIMGVDPYLESLRHKDKDEWNPKEFSQHVRQTLGKDPQGDKLPKSTIYAMMHVNKIPCMRMINSFGKFLIIRGYKIFHYNFDRTIRQVYILRQLAWLNGITLPYCFAAIHTLMNQEPDEKLYDIFGRHLTEIETKASKMTKKKQELYPKIWGNKEFYYDMWGIAQTYEYYYLGTSCLAGVKSEEMSIYIRKVNAYLLTYTRNGTIYNIRKLDDSIFTPCSLLEDGLMLYLTGFPGNLRSQILAYHGFDIRNAREHRARGNYAPTRQEDMDFICSSVLPAPNILRSHKWTGCYGKNCKGIKLSAVVTYVIGIINGDMHPNYVTYNKLQYLLVKNGVLTEPLTVEDQQKIQMLLETIKETAQAETTPDSVESY